MFKTLSNILSDLLDETVVAFLDASWDAVVAAHEAYAEHRRRVGQRRVAEESK